MLPFSRWERLEACGEKYKGKKSASDGVLPFSGDPGKTYKGVSAHLCDRKQLKKTESHNHSKDT